MRKLTCSLASILVVAACGGGPTDTTDGSGDPGTNGTTGTTEGAPSTTAGPGTTVGGPPAGDDPCGLATPQMVSAAFGGTVADGVPGIARNCDYAITGGIDQSVTVYHYGDSAVWEGVRQGFEDNRGGTTDVAGLGIEAFYPNDQGPLELVVQGEQVIFSVAANIFGSGGPEVEAALVDLAEAIAAKQG